MAGTQPNSPTTPTTKGGLWVHFKWTLLMLAIVLGLAAAAIPVLGWFGIEAQPQPAASPAGTQNEPSSG